MFLDQVPQIVIESLGGVLKKYSYYQPAAENVLQYKFGSWYTAVAPTYLFPLFTFTLQKQINTNPLSVLLLFFYCCQPLPSQLLKSIIGDTLFDDLVKHNIIKTAGEFAESEIQIIPFGKDLFVATEPPKKATGNVRYLGFDHDSVMTLFPDSYDLAKSIDNVRAASAIDLFCGNGVQALVLAKKVKTVVGVDINENALQYARFNATLNGFTNIKFERHDIKESLNLDRFEVVVANPPFCPASTQKTLFCDGGSSGDELARILLHDRLKEIVEEGGKVYMVASFALHRGETVKQKVQSLSSDQVNYDIHFSDFGQSTSDSSGINAFYASVVYFVSSKHLHNPSEYSQDLYAFLENLTRQGIESMAYGIVQLDNLHLLPACVCGCR